MSLKEIYMKCRPCIRSRLTTPLETGEGATAAPFPLPHPSRVPNNGEGIYTKTRYSPILGRTCLPSKVFNLIKFDLICSQMFVLSTYKYGRIFIQIPETETQFINCLRRRTKLKIVKTNCRLTVTKNYICLDRSSSGKKRTNSANC